MQGVSASARSMRKKRAGKDFVRQTRRNLQLIELSVPVCVGTYNQHTGGVDSLDQLRSYYGVGRAGRRWWKYLFWGILNAGLINAYILWVAANQPLLANARLFGLKAYKLKLVHELCDGHELRSRRQPAAVDNLTIAQVITDNVIEGHSLVKWVGRGRVCQVCARAHKKTAQG